MAYKQIVTPNINISARAGMCLEYVDNAVNAPKRTATAQIAYETANRNGCVSANTEYPENVWFVLFLSIDNNDYAGLGHVALAYVDSGGNMQIHDSEVHRGARRPYTSLAELTGWFGSVGTQMTYLGWSIGVDGVKLIEEEVKTTDEEAKVAQVVPELKGNKKMTYIFNVVDADGKPVGGTYMFDGIRCIAFAGKNGKAAMDHYVGTYKQMFGKDIPTQSKTQGQFDLWAKMYKVEYINFN